MIGIRLCALMLLMFVLSACTGGSGDEVAPNDAPPPVSQQPAAPSAPDVPAKEAGLLGGQYSGTIKNGKNFKFTLSDDGRQITEISADVLEYCGGSSSSSWTTLYFEGPFEVKEDGTVSIEGKEKHDDLSLTYTLTASFDSGGKASGTIEQSTVVVGSVCQTYKLEWEAQKQ